MTRRRVHPDYVWGALIGAGVAYETWALRRDLDCALSRRTRVRFRTHTEPGRRAFICTWTGLYVWFLRHILRGP